MTPRDALILVFAFAALVPLGVWAVSALVSLRASSGPALAFLGSAVCAFASVALYPVVPRIAEPILGEDWQTWQTIANVCGIAAIGLRACAGALLVIAALRVPGKQP